MIAPLGAAKRAGRIPYSAAPLKPRGRTRHDCCRAPQCPKQRSQTSNLIAASYTEDAAMPTSSTTPEERANLAEIDKSVELIGMMLTEVCNAVVMENATAFITNAGMEVTANKAVRDAVQSRLQSFNQFTLVVLTSMVQGMTGPEEAETKNLLMKIREEMVKQVGDTLPEELQTLDTIAKVAEQTARRDILMGKTLTELEQLGRASGQLLTEMEEADAIPDIKLLARLVIIHEELYAVMEDKEVGASIKYRTRRDAIPTTIAGFIQQLVKDPDPVMRRAKIFTALKAACVEVSKSEKSSKAGPDLIRPAAFMQTLFAIRSEMLVSEKANTPEFRTSMTKLRNLVSDSMLVIDDLSRGK